MQRETGGQSARHHAEAVARVCSRHRLAMSAWCVVPHPFQQHQGISRLLSAACCCEVCALHAAVLWLASACFFYPCIAPLLLALSGLCLPCVLCGVMLAGVSFDRLSTRYLCVLTHASQPGSRLQALLLWRGDRTSLVAVAPFLQPWF